MKSKYRWHCFKFILFNSDVSIYCYIGTKIGVLSSLLKVNIDGAASSVYFTIFPKVGDNFLYISNAQLLV